MAGRRADGTLQAEVLGVLWAAGEVALTPGQVNETLGERLAYTTVMTVLTRLWRKGLVERIERGRAFAYRAVVSETELATRKMSQTLQGASDQFSVLAGFVGLLSQRERAELAKLLGESEAR